MNSLVAYDPVIQGGSNSTVDGFSEDREQYYKQQVDQSNKQEELKLEQQKLQLQQQKQDTNQQLVIGGLVLGGILVISIAIYLSAKTFKKKK